MAAGVAVGGAALTPSSLGDPGFGLRGRARAGRGKGLELGGGGGARGRLPTGCQLLLLDDKLLLLLRLRLHRLRWLLQELGGLQRGVGCGDNDGGQGPPPRHRHLSPNRAYLQDPPPSLRLLLTLASVHCGAY